MLVLSIFQRGPGEKERYFSGGSKLAFCVSPGLYRVNRGLWEEIAEVTEKLERVMLYPVAVPIIATKVVCN